MGGAPPWGGNIPGGGGMPEIDEKHEFRVQASRRQERVTYPSYVVEERVGLAET